MAQDWSEVERFLQLFPTGDLVETLADEARLASLREALATIATQDIEIAMVAPGLVTTYAGVEGLEAGWRDWLEPFSTYRMEIEPDVRYGEGAVVLFARQVATPKGTGGEVTEDAAAVAFLGDGKVRRIEFHLDRGAALRSAGLDVG